MTDAPDRAMTPVGVNHLVLNVRDIEVAHDFWTEVMGFRHIGSLKDREERPMKMRFYNGLSESHHDLALAEIMGESEESGDWSMAPRRPGLNHLAVPLPRPRLLAQADRLPSGQGRQVQPAHQPRHDPLRLHQRSRRSRH